MYTVEKYRGSVFAAISIDFGAIPMKGKPTEDLSLFVDQDTFHIQNCSRGVSMPTSASSVARPRLKRQGRIEGQTG